MAYSIQFAGAVGVSNCAGGPRLSFFAGRSNISQPSPNLLVPEPDNTTDELIERFTDAGLDTATLISLLVSHTVAAQDHVDPVSSDAPWHSVTILTGLSNRPFPELLSTPLLPSLTPSSSLR